MHDTAPDPMTPRLLPCRRERSRTRRGPRCQPQCQSRCQNRQAMNASHPPPPTTLPARRYAPCLGLACLMYLSSVPAARAQAATPPAIPGTDIVVHDSLGRDVHLSQPARRAISLTPAITELVYAAGAGDRLVATVSASDYPAAARTLPRIGTGLALDPERLLAQRPDLLLAWLPDSAQASAQALARVGIPTYYSDPTRLDDIPREILRFGQLFGTQAQAAPTAARLAAQLKQLGGQYAQRPPVRVFIEVSQSPLYTLNGSDIINDALTRCGGINVFAHAPAAAPVTDRETVLAAHPQAVLFGLGPGIDAANLAQGWRHDGLNLPQAAFIGIDDETLFRPGPRLIQATAQLCEALERVRETQGTHPHPQRQ